MKMALLALSLILASAAPAAASDERRWNFLQDEEGASLSFAIPESDDDGPFFYCQRKEGTVGVVMFVERRIAVGEPDSRGRALDARGVAAPWPTQMTLASGKVTVAMPAGANSAEMTGGTLVEAKVPVTSTVLAAFARTGEIRLMAYGETAEMPPAPKARVRALLNACRR